MTVTNKKTMAQGRPVFRRVLTLLFAAALLGLPGCRLMVSQRINGLAYESVPTGIYAPFNLSFMYEDGSRQKPLVNDFVLDKCRIAWSPDGSKIAFSLYIISVGNFIYVMNADGSNRTQLTTTGIDMNPAWSPDGTKIAYNSSVGQSTDIIVMNSDGSNKNQLTSTIADTWHENPVWSPDSRKIAYTTSYARNSGMQISVIGVDGHNNIPVATTSTGRLTKPCWSPGGKKILYILNDDSIGAYSLCSIAADGSGIAQNLTPAPNNTFPMDNQMYSPNGTRIMFQVNLGNVNQVMVIDSDGNGRKSLTQNGSDNQYPAWSPDGKKIAWSSNYPSFLNNGAYNIWIMNADGSGQFNATNYPDTSTYYCIIPVWRPR